MAKEIPKYDDNISFSVVQVARMIGTKTQNIYDLIEMGYIHPLELGNKKIDRWEIRNFIEKYRGRNLSQEIKDWKSSKNESGKVIQL